VQLQRPATPPTLPAYDGQEGCAGESGAGALTGTLYICTAILLLLIEEVKLTWLEAMINRPTASAVVLYIVMLLYCC